MSRNLALEKVGRARVAYALLQRGWKVGEAYDDGYDILAYHPNHNIAVYIELKSMDISNRTPNGNLTAPISPKEQVSCSHIVIYVEPHGWFFIAKKEDIITEHGNIFAALNEKRELRKSRDKSKSFAKYQDCWDELLP